MTDDEKTDKFLALLGDIEDAKLSNGEVLEFLLVTLDSTLEDINSWIEVDTLMFDMAADLRTSIRRVLQTHQLLQQGFNNGN